MRQRLLIVLFSTLACNALAQFNLSFHSGVGYYKMAELKIFNDVLSGSYPPGGKVTSNFPSYYTFGMDALYSLSHLKVGLSTDFGSSGGRVYYSDYSGEISSSQALSFNSLSIAAGGRWQFANRFEIVVDPRPTFVFSRAHVEQRQRINGPPGNNYRTSLLYNSFNFAFQPTVSLSARFGAFTLGGYAGYNLTLVKNNFKQVGDYFSADDLSLYSADWSGFRIGGTVGVNLTKRTESFNPKLQIGMGLGLDYGGVGVNFTYYVIPNIGFFGGAGHNFAGLGLNAGTRFLITHDIENKVVPFVTWMYGYNAVVKVKDIKEYNRVFYGHSASFGFDIKTSDTRRISLGVVVPFRNDDPDDYITLLKSRGVGFKRGLSPVLVSLGMRLYQD